MVPMIRLTSSLSCLVLVGVIACGSEVAETGGSGGGGAGAAGVGGAGTGVGGAANGGGGASSCELSPGEPFEAKLTLPGGAVVEGCQGYLPGDPPVSHSVEGAVVDGDFATGLSVDTCAPNEACDPDLALLEIAMPGVAGTIPAGTFVRIDFDRGLVGDPSLPKCGHHVVVTNVPTWGGAQNPTEDGERVWLVGHHASASQYAEPFVVTTSDGCEPNDMNRVDILEVQAPDAPDVATVAHGTSASWEVTAGPQAGLYTVRNLNTVINLSHPLGDTRYFLKRAD